MLVPFALLCASLSLPLYCQAAATPKCKTDSCLKIVQEGKKPGGFGGCNSFLEKTVVPPPVVRTVPATTTTTSTSVTRTTISPITSITVTTTSTSTTTTTVKTVTSSLAKRSIAARAVTSETEVPRYARDQCQNTARYSSACSCVGAQVKTTTAKASTTTKTQFVTRTASTTSTSTITSSSTDASTTTESTVVTVSTTATVTQSLECVQPTQLVYNPSYEDNYFDPNFGYKATNWTFVDTYLVIGNERSAIQGAALAGFHSDDGSGEDIDDGNRIEGGTLSQELTNPIPTNQKAGYSLDVYLGEVSTTDAEAQYSFSISLGGTEIVPKQLVCPPGACTISVPNANLKYQRLTATGILNSLSSTPKLEIQYYAGAHQRYFGTFVDVFTLSLTTPDAC